MLKKEIVWAVHAAITLYFLITSLSSFSACYSQSTNIKLITISKSHALLTVQGVYNSSKKHLLKSYH